jgi:hypothetical protein
VKRDAWTAGREPRSGERLLLCVGWASVGLLLMAALPLFVCMPLWSDATILDLCGRTFLRTGGFYREIFHNGSPGMIWLQAGVRRLFGWRSEVLRFADAVVVVTIVCLLIWDLSPQGRPWLAFFLLVFYFSTPEGCHCQRDLWMLLPALLALRLHEQEATALMRGETPNKGRVFGEGIYWGIAILIKPFVAVPGAACWLRSAIQVRRWQVVNDALCRTAGVAAVGCGAVLWLWWSGDWSAFVETHLHSDYYQGGPPLWARVTEMTQRFWPWSLVNVAAIPTSIALLAMPSSTFAPVLAAFYLGWLFQANFIQWQFHYHQVPTIFLGARVLAEIRWPVMVRFAAFALLIWGLFAHPLLARLSLWPRCWTEGSTADLRDRLTLDAESYPPTWKELEEVQRFLESQQVRDKELTCFSTASLPLYLSMGLEPPTRFHGEFGLLVFFPRRHDEIMQAMAASPERFVVTDLLLLGLKPEQVRGRIQLGPQLSTTAPWKYPVVYHSGRYWVHAVPQKPKSQTKSQS